MEELSKMTKEQITGLAYKILAVFLMIQGTSIMANAFSFAITTPLEFTGNLILPYIFVLVFGIVL
jgi:hypothetical protein